MIASRLRVVGGMQNLFFVVWNINLAVGFFILFNALYAVVFDLRIQWSVLIFCDNPHLCMNDGIET